MSADNNNYNDLVRRSVRIPKGAVLLVVLAQIGDALWCASTDPPKETLRHLEAARKQLLDDTGVVH